MSAMRQDFIKNYDWIRRSLMFEPRGHDCMSGAFLFPSTRDDCDIGILYIEVSGCLPMCGHGTIGTVTFALENDLVTPKTPGILNLDTPAGKVVAHYKKNGSKIETVKIYNVPSYLAEVGIIVSCPDLGEIIVDISYGGNFYAIVEPQKNYEGLDEFSVADILRFSPIIRDLINEEIEIIHPEDNTIKDTTHLFWASAPEQKPSHGRGAVFYGDKAIDRSPCGTGTSARMAQLFGKGKLHIGGEYINESIIGSVFKGRVEEVTQVGQASAIIPSIEGWANVTGHNKIYVDENDPFKYGFKVK